MIYLIKMMISIYMHRLNYKGCWFVVQSCPRFFGVLAPLLRDVIATYLKPPSSLIHVMSFFGVNSLDKKATFICAILWSSTEQCSEATPLKLGYYHIKWPYFTHSQIRKRHTIWGESIPPRNDFTAKGSCTFVARWARVFLTISGGTEQQIIVPT